MSYFYPRPGSLKLFSKLSSYSHSISSNIELKLTIRLIQIKHIVHWYRGIHLRMVFQIHILFIFCIFLFGIFILMDIPCPHTCQHIRHQPQLPKDGSFSCTFPFDKILLLGIPFACIYQRISHQLQLTKVYISIQGMNHMTIQLRLGLHKVHSQNRTPAWFHQESMRKQLNLELEWCYQDSYWRMDDHKKVNTVSYIRHGMLGNAWLRSWQEGLRRESEVWASYFLFN